MWTSAAFSQKVVRSRAFSDGPQLRLRISSPRQPSRLISSLPCSPRRSAAEAAVQPLFSLQLCGSLIPLHLRRLKSTCIVRNISKLGRLQQAIEILEVRTLEPPPGECKFTFENGYISVLENYFDVFDYVHWISHDRNRHLCQ